MHTIPTLKVHLMLSEKDCPASKRMFLQHKSSAKERTIEDVFLEVVYVFTNVDTPPVQPHRLRWIATTQEARVMTGGASSTDYAPRTAKDSFCPFDPVMIISIRAVNDTNCVDPQEAAPKIPCNGNCVSKGGWQVLHLDAGSMLLNIHVSTVEMRSPTPRMR